MNTTLPPWDYLIVTASNTQQAEVYASQLRLRQDLGMLSQAGKVLVLADPEGRRIGSGGSTLFCLATVINHELDDCPVAVKNSAAPFEILQRLRILIIHAGGDSKRLPAYGPCGKIFVPLPEEDLSVPGQTLFDRNAAELFSLPAPANGKGQVVVVSGDALLLFRAGIFQPAESGVTVLSNFTGTEEARRHGVYCVNAHGALRLYLQKPTGEEQQRHGAVDRSGRVLLDLGLMSFEATTAAVWLKAFDFSFNPDGRFGWSEEMKAYILAHELDLYREICCAMGMEADETSYLHTVRSSGSQWEETALHRIFPQLHAIPMHVLVAPKCRFLHFGTTRQLHQSSRELLDHDQQPVPPDWLFSLNNEIHSNFRVFGSHAWMEGCRLRAPLTLDGGNVLVGVDVETPLHLPREACLDVLWGVNRHGQSVYFIRCYGLIDTFKDTISSGALFCGRLLSEWLGAIGAKAEQVYSGAIPWEMLTLWDARVFPAVTDPGEYRNWLWMYQPDSATAEQKLAWHAADRYSAADIALLANPPHFHQRRMQIRSRQPGETEEDRAARLRAASFLRWSDNR